MSHSNQKSNSQEKDVEVLYQKLGENWFAFSIIDEDVFMSPVPEEKIEEIKREGFVNFTPKQNEAV